ncbi:hypothetical protein ACFLSE_05510 [Bacteroidota bacterium]
MVRKLILFSLVFALSISIFAQVPDAFKYQAVIQNSSGEILPNQNISLRISILDGSATGTNVFTETHLETTSDLGLIAINIGKGTLVSGDFSTINWSTGDKYLKVAVDENGGSSYTDLGAVELLSIPYALYANEVLNKDDADADPTNEYQVLSISNDTIYLTNGGFVKLPVDNINDADADPSNEIQDLDLTSNVLTITNHASPTEIDLAPYQGTNTDEQTLNLAGTDLTITGGNTIDLSPIQDGVDDADNDPANELQNLQLIGDTLKIDNANQVVFTYDSSQWINNGNQLYYNTGNVGIGSSSPVSNLEIKATTKATGALFQVINANNDTVFAVFPDGVKIYVDPDAKGKVGGFAISGKSPNKVGEIDYMRVTGDSTRIYVNEPSETKGKVGGFAISGRSPNKGVVHDYLVVTNDSTRIYVNDTATLKGKVGGFAISGRSPNKGTINDYLKVTRDSTRVYINEDAGKGKVGGFAISGRSPNKGIETDYFNVSGNTAAEIINNEARVMWYPKKAALLAGEVHVGSADSVGTNSTALGYRSISKGEFSQAMGYNARALGNNSTAIGNNAVADSANSYAFGNNTYVGGVNSYAFGDSAFVTKENSYAIGAGAKATGKYSFAIGSHGFDYNNNPTDVTKATGDYSYAFGMGSIASGKGAFAIGTQDTASGYYSTVMGYNSTASGNYSTTIGYRSNASGEFSTALGYYTTASGDNGAAAIGQMVNASGISAIALGAYSWASGARSTAMGIYTTASGDVSTAMGSSTYAIGDNSTAMGLWTFANAYCSSTMGYYTIANGMYSTAINYLTTANGHNSTAMGRYTNARSYCETTIGAYNDTTFSAEKWSWEDTDPIFIVGNGTSNSVRKNALMVLKNGNTGIGGYPGATGTNVFAIKTGTVPTGSITDGVLLYADGTSAELKVMDETGNITTLSPHNFSLITKSEPMAWSFYSKNLETEQTINVDMLRAIRLIEELSGEQLVVIKDFEEKAVSEFDNNKTSLSEKVKLQQIKIEQQEKEIEELLKENIEFKNRLTEIEKLLMKD